LREKAVWLRFYDEQGQVVAAPEELAEQAAEIERSRAEVLLRQYEEQLLRAQAAEAELARLRALLSPRSGEPGNPPT
jgi:hypothetical protein